MTRPPLVAALLLAAAASLGAKEGTPVAGSYCPLPQGDEPPECLEPATREYDAFFERLERGEIHEEASAEVERDLASGEGRYEALSSLAFAYYLLSRRAAESEAEDPLIAERLERWNAVFRDAYRASQDQAFRGAVRQAAGDLEDRAPAVRIRCTDEEGRVTECDSTTAMLAALNERWDRTGVRGAIGRLLRRLLGDDG